MVAVLSRTRWGLDAANHMRAAGHRVTFVATTKAEPFYGCGVEDYRAFASEIGARFVDASSLPVRELAAAMPDDCVVALSVNWPTVLSADVIGNFPLGVVNAHAGDLPRYRGNACPNWAIINGEPHVGLCAHLMEPDALDTGPVLGRELFPLSPTTYISEVYAWLDVAVPKILADAAGARIAGTCKPVPQSSDPSQSLRCYPRRPEDGRINWQASALVIHRLIRASSHPFAGAFAFLADGRRVTVRRASLFEHPGPFCAVPGQFMLRTHGGTVVACGRGCLLIEEAEIEGMTLAETMRELARSLRGRFI